MPAVQVQEVAPQRVKFVFVGGCLQGSWEGWLRSDPSLSRLSYCFTRREATAAPVGESSTDTTMFEVVERFWSELCGKVDRNTLASTSLKLLFLVTSLRSCVMMALLKTVWLLSSSSEATIAR